MIIDDIVEYSERYRKTYGESTLCLFQIGDFFEMNAFFENGTLYGVDMYTVCNLINIQVTRKNKSIVENSRSNPLMAGFPLAALQKYTSVLISQGWTIIVVRQVTPPPNVRREVTEILSPTTILNPINTESNYLICVVFEPFIVNSTPIMSVGIAGIDVSTGTSFTYEGYSSISDPHFSYDEVFRILDAYSPREILVLKTKKCNGDSTITREIENCTKCHSQSIVHCKYVDHQVKPSFQSEVLLRAFRQNINDLGLENYHIASTALTAAIQFVYDHNETIITKLKIPTHIHQSKYLTLQYNSAIQLQLISTSNTYGEKPLMSILNRCATPFGRRMFRERILSPIHDIRVLNTRYDAIDTMIDNKVYIDISNKLSQVGDIERMARRIRLNTFSPIDWCNLQHSLQCIEHVLGVLNKADDVAIVRNIMRAFESVINIEEASKYLLTDIKGNIFVHAYSDDIDQHEMSITSCSNVLRNIEKCISSIEPCSLDFNDRDGYFINITKKRWDSVKAKTITINGISISEFTSKPISSVSNVVRISHKNIESASTKIYELQSILQKMVTDTYIEFLQTFDIDNGDSMIYIANTLADIDIAATCAKNAIEYKYSRPILVDTSDTTKSFISAEAMRHPIIEHIHTDVEYVPNDVSLGKDYGGMLLYGLNSSGKSSYMKSIGLNVIMAQSGMFVAASKMMLAPYHSLFTRIQNNDNVYKRMSSFTVEMTELRNIFQRCNPYSLVLGDELCSGTESISATSIVAAGTLNLLSKNVGFVFATHLHELVDLPIIQDKYSTGNLKVSHIHVESTAAGSFIYHRKLREGSGNSIYGLEVCAALGMPSDFINLAYTIRKHFDKHNELNTNTSKYNTKVYVNTCKVCNVRPATEVHHIKYRSNDGDNKSSNLVPLCTQCHDEEHNGMLSIKGYLMTSNGRKLNFEWEDKDKYKVEDKDKFDESIETRHQDETDVNSMYVNILKPFLKYGVSGWQIKRTCRSTWKVVNRESLNLFINKKLENNHTCSISNLSSYFLVL